jgi:TonB-linked SusC/RagA family outer membrane protein
MRSKFKWIFTLIVAFTMQFSFAQEKTVTGVVSDDLGAVAGASVVVKGTTRGVTTDFDGNYSISAKAGDVLMVSFAGQTGSVTVGAGNVYDVKLSALVGEEVIVTGALGIKRKADEVTTSYTVVKNDELTQASAPSLAQALVGKVSGLQITTTNSSVNSSNSIVINGPRSITGNNQALIVIDNAISTATVFQSLPPEIVESVNVIKGAQGSALYGEAGSNGVIIVTTKRGGGKDGKVSVNVTSSIDFQQISYLPVRQTRYGQGWYGENIAIENGSWGAEFNGANLPVGLPQADGSQIYAPYVGNSDNIKDFFRTGTILQNGVSISGGDLETGFVRLSLNKLTNNFVIDKDDLNRSNVSFRAGKKMGRLTVEGGANFYTTKVNSAAANQSNDSSGIYALLLQAATNIPISAFENSGINGHWTAYYRNPYWMRDNIRNAQTSNFFSGNLSLQYEINKNINIVWNPNVQLTTGSSTTFVNAFATGSSPETDIYSSYSTRSIISSFSDNTDYRRELYSDVLVNLNYNLTDNLTFAANVGNNIREFYFKRNSVGGSNLDTYGSFYNYNNVLQPSLASALDNDYSKRRTYSFFANVDLGYKEYLNLNLTARNDWSSLLDKSNNSYFYPGVGLSFIPTKAFPSIKGKVLHYAKLYTSYTGTGNSTAVSIYGIDAVGSVASGFPFGDLSSYVVNQNPTYAFIKPERNYTKDIGVSLGFFNDRLTLDGQYYYTQTKDLITRATASATSGLSSALLNVGELHNTGFNLDLGFTAIKAKETGDFGWNTKVNLSHYLTIVDKVAPGQKEVNLLQGGNNGDTGIFAIEGQPFPSIKAIGYQRDEQGRVKLAANGNPLYSSELINFGRTTPDYVLGLTNIFAYKGVTLKTVFDYRTGGKFYSAVKGQLAWTGNLVESAENGRTGGFIFPNSVVDTNGDGIFEPNTNVVTGGNSYNSYQTYFSNDNYNNNAENSILDGTAFKVREVALSYTFPKKLVENMGITNLTLGVNGRNLFLWLPKENKYYTDPESSNTSAGNSNAFGITTVGQYPLTRTYGFTLNLTF